MKTFKDLVKGDKIYYLFNNKIKTFIFEGFDPFDAFWGKGYDLIISDSKGNKYRAGVTFDATDMNFTSFLNYYASLGSLMLSVINEDV